MSDLKSIMVFFVKIIKKLISLYLIIATFVLYADTKVLNKNDVLPILQQMMIYHVENQTLDTTVIKRSFKVLLDQIDPDKVYFLESEAVNYLDLDEDSSEKILMRLKKQDFKDYQNFLKQAQSTIYRARNIRIKKLDEFKKRKYFEFSIQNNFDKSGYPDSKSILVLKNEQMVKSWWDQEKLQPGFAEFTIEEKDKSMRIYERRLEKVENFYLGVDSKGKSLSKEQLDHNFSTILLKAFAKSLDAHTCFFSPEEATSMRTSLQKQFRGIGVVLRENGQGVYIADLIKGGPAFDSKTIQKGDLLIAINGISLSDKNFEEVLEMMQGLEGSGIKLTLQRKSQPDSKPFDIVLLRKKIVLEEDRLSYSYEPFANGIIATINFNAFYDNGEGITTEKDFKNALKVLRQKGEILGLVIDLRQNPGGFLSQAVKVSGMFVPQGVIAIAKYSTGEIQYSRDLDGKMVYNGPCVLMTSKASASAAEVVAQALQDYGVALVVGDERTYGKGSMQFQNITEENADAFFKVTVGRYYTISGRSTQIDGVIADLVVPSYYAPYPIGERFLQYPIQKDDLGFSFLDPNNPFRKFSGFDNQQMFSSYFSRQQLRWKVLLPTLKKNSQERISKNEEYQNFLKKSQEYQEGKKTAISQWKNDFQHQECLNIIKDMILIESNKLEK